MKRGMAAVSSKGQLVIPARLRRRLGVRKGTRVSFLEDQGEADSAAGNAGVYSQPARISEG